jgi:hypothetical protein
LERLAPGKKLQKLLAVDIFRRLETESIRYAIHALERLAERKILRASVEAMLKGITGHRFLSKRHDKFVDGYWRYRVHGKGLDGEKIAVAVLIDDQNGPLVITVMDID